MSDPHIARLEQVSLRAAWADEARNFTPWLHENLDALGEALGLRLEPDATEVRVESFSADILARNQFDGTAVLIENQLERSDHTHLGQIMTYLAGLDARTIIWVAADFTDAHLSAINWLNEHTDESIGFFAVRVKAVRIADSPLAPVFDVLARPNNWEKQLFSAARSGERTELSTKRHEFWNDLVNRIPDELERFGPPSYLNRRWRQFPDLPFVISMYLSSKGAGLFIRSKRGESEAEFSRLLESKRPELEERLGVNMGSKYFFEDIRPGDFTDPDQRPALIKWLAARADEYETVLREVFNDA